VPWDGRLFGSLRVRSFLRALLRFLSLGFCALVAFLCVRLCFCFCGVSVADTLLFTSCLRCWRFRLCAALARISLTKFSYFPLFHDRNNANNDTGIEANETNTFLRRPQPQVFGHLAQTMAYAMFFTTLSPCQNTNRQEPFLTQR